MGPPLTDIGDSRGQQAVSTPDIPPEHKSAGSLIARYSRHHDPRLREEVILAYENLVRHIATRFTSRGEPFDDLMQAGMIGLIKAVDRFDPSRQLKFSTYAVPTIAGEIKRYLRDHGWHINVPRRLKELHFSAVNSKAALAGTLGRSPTLAELAEALSVSTDELIEAIGIGQLRHPISGSYPMSPTESLGQTVEDSFRGDDHIMTSVAARMDLQEALDALDPRMKAVIVGRYFEERTQLEIAQRLNISQMHVSRLHARALRRLRERLNLDAKR